MQARLLALVLADSSREWTVGDLAREVGGALTSVQTEVTRLAGAGVFSTRKVGRTRLVRANDTSPFALPLRQLAQLAVDGPSAAGANAASVDLQFAQAPDKPGVRIGGPLAAKVHGNREQIRRIVRDNRGRSVFVFGSVARGEETPDSDIDFLVEFEPGSSLFDLVHINDELQQLLGCSVDVVSVGGLKPRDKHILREAVPI